jgi:hypothetical protein
LSSSSRAQIHFSIDYKGMTIGTPATGSGVPITEGDILVPAAPGMLPAYGPLPPPMIFASGGFGPPAPGLGLPAHPGCIGHPPAFPCGVEVDALSYGMDYAVPRRPLPAGTYVFSVDECSSGLSGIPAAGERLHRSSGRRRRGRHLPGSRSSARAAARPARRSGTPASSTGTAS